ncbi:MAG: TonB-dependent receptor [Sphingobacteriaceae bacterium]|nr:MAG: TonB-dependent receptor [Sphingobacteriaceae bacterium]
MKRIHCLLFLLLVGNIVLAQKKTITGKVTNQATGAPLQGVNILADKIKGGAVSNADGSYSIAVNNSTSTLIFSFVGFASQTVIIDGRTTIDVSLSVAAVSNDEVVVIGYGTQKRSQVTGAISKYQNERLDEAPVSRLDQALQGKIAGVQIQNVSSEAGAEAKINVRGVSSIGANASPLVVVDGHPIQDGLSFVNMADVQSVEVLKDAASAAIYGSRGANGVILITTKSGKAEKPKYSVKFSNGYRQAYETYPMMSTSEYTNLLYYEAALKATDSTIAPPTGTQIIANNERAAYIVENTIMQGKGTDWQNEALRAANVRNVQLAVSGGSKTLKYFISGAYQKDQGLMYHSEYDKYSLRTKLDGNLSNKMKFSFNLNPSFIKRERPSVGFIDFVRFQSFLPVYHTTATAAFVNQSPTWANIKAGDFVQARHFNGRMYSGLMPDGTLYTSTANLDPFNTANNTPKSVMETRTITSNEYRVQSAGDITYSILPGLDFKAMGSVYAYYSEAVDFAKRNSNRDGDVNRGQYNNRLFIDMLSENTLNYTKKIKKHSFNVLAGFTAQKTLIRREQIVASNFPSDNIQTASTALLIEQPFTDANNIVQGTYNLKEQVGLLSYLGRVMYSYGNKYLVSASMRADGSSKFAPGNKWGNFPSVSLGWVPSEEKFLRDTRWINNLKLRASYGVTGNNRIDDFGWLDLLYPSNYPLGAGTGTSVSGQVPNRVVIANRDITWESTFQYNTGFDLALFRNSINLSVNLYQSKTDALLLKQSSMAFAGAPLFNNNIGRLQNRGVEVELTTNNVRRKDFKWSTSLNFSHNKNKLLQLGEEAFLLNQGERTELYRNMPGRPLVEYFGYKTDGVWLSQKQITEAQAAGLTSALSNVFVPGGLKIVDLNGDNVLDANDRTAIGSPYPAFTWGINNNFNFKSVDISFLFQGSQGGQLVNGDPNYNETKRYNRNYNENRWVSPLFPGDGKTPYSTVGFNWMLTDYVVEDASYVALREVVVGYTLPAKVAKTVHLTSLRVYLSGQNLFFRSASGYRGINTEARSTSGVYDVPTVDGYQRGGFPMPRTVLFGIDINF